MRVSESASLPRPRAPRRVHEEMVEAEDCRARLGSRDALLPTDDGSRRSPLPVVHRAAILVHDGGAATVNEYIAENGGFGEFCAPSHSTKRRSGMPVTVGSPSYRSPRIDEIRRGNHESGRSGRSPP